MQREDVLGRLDDLVVVKSLNILFAHALDVERVARYKMFEAFNALRRTNEPAGAAAHHINLARLFVRLAHGVAITDRASRGKTIRLGTLGPLAGDNADDLRDHIACPLHDHGIADAHVLAIDLVLVVQCGV